MSRNLYLSLIASVLLVLCTRVDAQGPYCLLCPTQDLEDVNTPTTKDYPGPWETLDHWTCSSTAQTLSCFYPSAADPGTYNDCTYSGETGFLVSGPSNFCVGDAVRENKCDEAIFQGANGCSAPSGTTQ
ncbi:hypothetical protein JAAARDRAFT_60031 [Jaapia argillacea MUCL 33604]|uniref:Uncharacterized protein n=1 Tax=Jaapia argillacea MUCL 33604 TaxID=933084 RepID=A0A067PJR2_9AGAM|nr:hypothetical protein JAAARDRAFT_60031 [Jaapia argillacea MUCL 33604]